MQLAASGWSSWPRRSPPARRRRRRAPRRRTPRRSRRARRWSSGDYAKAADLYRSALAAEPESLPLHYGLGVAASYLDRRADAVREFTWVLGARPADSAEVNDGATLAAERRRIAPPRERSRPSPRRIAESRAKTPAEGTKPAPAMLQGRALFDESPGRVRPMERMQLLLSRLSGSRGVSPDPDGRGTGRFRFADVPPGDLQAHRSRVAGQPRWRLRVELKPGQDLTLDLDPANSTRVRDDFPEHAAAVT